MQDRTATRIAAVRSVGELADTAAMFRAYADSLDVDLAYQDFEAELASLPGRYAPPAGELLLARTETGRPVGCVALRPLGPADACEMKRLYVSPEGRGTGLGRSLVEAVIRAAGRIGYREIRLDTLPSMGPAIALYRSAGFGPAEPFGGPTPPGTLFMRHELRTR